MAHESLCMTSNFSSETKHGSKIAFFNRHDDVMIWTHYPHYWHFRRGIRRLTMYSPYKGPVMRSFDGQVFFY